MRDEEKKFVYNAKTSSRPGTRSSTRSSRFGSRSSSNSTESSSIPSSDPGTMLPFWIMHPTIPNWVRYPKEYPEI